MTRAEMAARLTDAVLWAAYVCARDTPYQDASPHPKAAAMREVLLDALGAGETAPTCATCRYFRGHVLTKHVVTAGFCEHPNFLRAYEGLAGGGVVRIPAQPFRCTFHAPVDRAASPKEEL